MKPTIKILLASSALLAMALPAGTYAITEVPGTPEPGSWALMVTGLTFIGWTRRKFNATAPPKVPCRCQSDCWLTEFNPPHCDMT